VSKQLTDVQLLERLCREPYLSKLGQKASDAFPKWLEEGRELSPKMRKWIRGTAESLGLQTAPSENLFSQLSPEEQERQRKRAAEFGPRLPWEK
jgi:hypothetical protein